MPYFATHGFRLSVLRPCHRSQVLNELKLWNKLELGELTAVKDSFKLTPILMLSIGPSLENNVNIGLTMVEPLAQPFTFDGVRHVPSSASFGIRSTV